MYMQHIMVGQSEHLDGLSLSLSLFWMLLIYPSLNNAFEEEKTFWTFKHIKSTLNQPGTIFLYPIN